MNKIGKGIVGIGLAYIGCATIGNYGCYYLAKRRNIKWCGDHYIGQLSINNDNDIFALGNTIHKSPNNKTTIEISSQGIVSIIEPNMRKYLYEDGTTSYFEMYQNNELVFMENLNHDGTPYVNHPGPTGHCNL